VGSWRWEVGGEKLEVGGGRFGSWRLEVGGYFEGDINVFLKAAMLFIKSKACL
jgi:hypothetical protein